MSSIARWLLPLTGHITGQTLSPLTTGDIHAIRFIRQWNPTDSATLWLGNADELFNFLHTQKAPPGSVFFSAGGEAPLMELAQHRQLTLVATDLDVFSLYDLLCNTLCRRQEWTLRLLEAAGLRRSIQDVVDVGASLSGGALFLLNAGKRVIYAGHTTCPNSGPARDLLDMGRLSKPFSHLLLPPETDAFLPCETHCHTIDGNGRYWVQRVYKNPSLISYMVLFVPSSRCSEDIPTLLDLIRKNVSRISAAEGGGYWAGTDFKALLSDLVSCRLTDEQEICHRFSLISRSPQHFCTFIILESATSPGLAAAPASLLAQLEAIFPECNAACYDNAIVLLISRPNRDFQPMPVFDRQQFQELLVRNDAYASISNATSRRAMLRTNYLLAKSVLQLGRALCPFPQTRIFFFEDYAEYVAIDLCINSFGHLMGHDDIIYLTHPDAVELYRYDLVHKTRLLDVLYYYCLNNCSISRAAKAAYMHRNTFSTHLAKLQDLIKADLSSGEIQQRMVFSFKILHYYSHYAKINLGTRLGTTPSQERKE